MSGYVVLCYMLELTMNHPDELIVYGSWLMPITQMSMFVCMRLTKASQVKQKVNILYSLATRIGS